APSQHNASSGGRPVALPQPFWGFRIKPPIASLNESVNHVKTMSWKLLTALLTLFTLKLIAGESRPAAVRLLYRRRPTGEVIMGKRLIVIAASLCFVLGVAAGSLFLSGALTSQAV